jgi:hypothetical protein
MARNDDAPGAWPCGAQSALLLERLPSAQFEMAPSTFGWWDDPARDWERVWVRATAFEAATPVIFSCATAESVI